MRSSLRDARRIGGALILAGLMLAGSCLGSMLISDEQERELGLQVVAELESSEDFELLGDRDVDAYINDIAQRVLAGSPVQRSFPFTFKVAVNDQVNAFALPGGYCYVFTGLIEAADSESELVGVIAHEVSHVTGGHHREQLANQYLIRTAEGFVFNENTGAATVAAARVASGLGMLSYGRRQESEADRLGVEAMWNSGWNPRGLRDFFETLSELQEREPGRIEGLLSTHPANAARIEDIEAMVEALPARGDLISDTPRFHMIQQRVRDLLGH